LTKSGNASWVSGSGTTASGEGPKDIRNLVVGFQWVSERTVEPNFVHVVSTLFAPDHVAGIDQIGHDAVDRSLTDSDESGDVDKTDFRVLGDAQQNMGMVGQECPFWELCWAGCRFAYHEISVSLE
jgi:hypothetical protein